MFDGCRRFVIFKTAANMQPASRPGFSYINWRTIAESLSEQWISGVKSTCVYRHFMWT
jgi:hypothetical protein